MVAVTALAAVWGAGHAADLQRRTALTSVGYIDSTALSALVDAPAAGLPAGDYQVIIVNPDGTVGFQALIDLSHAGLKL